jgi:hypothetical protein
MHISNLFLTILPCSLLVSAQNYYRPGQALYARYADAELDALEDLIARGFDYEGLNDIAAREFDIDAFEDLTARDFDRWLMRRDGKSKCTYPGCNHICDEKDGGRHYHPAQGLYARCEVPKPEKTYHQGEGPGEIIPVQAPGQGRSQNVANKNPTH